MKLESITLIALSLALAGCGNKGPLVQAGPPSVESTPADAEPAAPAETVPVETAPADVPAEVPSDEPPAAEPPADDAQDG